MKINVGGASFDAETSKETMGEHFTDVKWDHVHDVL
jgi:hypothetical protein